MSIYRLTPVSEDIFTPLIMPKGCVSSIVKLTAVFKLDLEASKT